METVTRLEAEHGLRCAIDLGGSSIRLGLGSTAEGLTSVTTDSVTRNTKPDTVVEFISREVDGMGERPSSLGFAFPGLLSADGRIQRAPNLDSSWQGFELERVLHDALGMPVSVGNDARLAALGELAFGGWFSADLALSSCLVYLGLGTGVGGGVVINGKVHEGASGSAGELGHVVIDAQGDHCVCGGRGCVETIAGGAALVEQGRALVDAGRAPNLGRLIESAPMNVALMAQAAAEGDRAVAAVVERAARALGVLCANLVHTLSPDVIVFGGGVAGLGQQLLEPLTASLREHVFMVPLDSLRIEMSQLSGRSGLLGALVLAEQLQ